MATETNLPPMARGDDIKYDILVDSSTVIDITGDIIYMTIKKSATDPDVLADMRRVLIVPSDANSVIGIATVIFTAAETAVTAGVYFYDVQWKRIVSGSDEIVTLLTGKVNIKQDVTHSTEENPL